jgi:hypothetical protein
MKNTISKPKLTAASPNFAGFPVMPDQSAFFKEEQY